MCRRGSAQVGPIQPLCVLTGWCAQGDLVAQALRARVRPWLERERSPVMLVSGRGRALTAPSPSG